MRVLITSTGFPGHLLPLLPFARAFAEDGHEVCMAAPRRAAPIAERAGLSFCGLADLGEDEEVQALVATVAALPQEEGHVRMIREGFADLAARRLVGDLLRIAGAWRPDVVVRESQEFAGALAAEHHGIPHARVALGLASSEEETLALAAPAVDELRAGLGLPGDPFAERLRAVPCFTLVPAGLEPTGAPPGLSFREHLARPAPLPDWWGESRDPLVYVTFGSMAGSLGFAPGFFRAAVDALAALPVRTLLTTGEDADPAALGPLPANVHAERWVEQDAALAQAAAVVCHGGYGTVVGALARGVPLALVPLFAGDQWRNARRVAEVGAGIALDGEARAMFEPPGPGVLEALPRAVERLLADSAYRQAAGRVAAEMEALPPVRAAAGVLPGVAV